MARHKDFGSAMLAYRSRPEGDPEPVKTNWTVVPANDNAAPEEMADYSFERSLRITPSVEEIMRNASAGPVERNDADQIVRIGKLRFSDGSQTETAYALGPDGDVIRMSARMPTGAMLGTREKSETQLGGKGYTSTQLEQSNLYFANMLGAIEPRYIPRTVRRNGKSLTADESRAVLAEAIANTDSMPPVTKLLTGLPCGAPRIADSFLGMQKGGKGESGTIMWQDLASAIVQREIWDETLAQLSERDVATLDAAMKARSFAEVGVADGQSPQYADKRSGGRKRLEAANNNLVSALMKSAG